MTEPTPSPWVACAAR